MVCLLMGWFALAHLDSHSCECAADLRVFNKGNEVVVITEIMQNPSAVSDSNGEWFELFNPSSTPVNLNGWTIRDNGSESHLINTDLVIASGAYVVVGRNANSTNNGGIVVQYQYQAFTLSNGADEIILLRPDQTLADEVWYDGGPSFPDPSGKSMVLSSATLDNSLGSSWVQSQEIMPNGDYGTPGSGPDTVSQASLIITEVMQNPSAVSDSNGEWFEVFNPGPTQVNLNGWTLRDHGSDSHLISQDVIVPAGVFFVLGRNNNASTNGGITVDYVYSGFYLTNGADEVLLVDTGNNVVDEIDFDGGPNWPNPNGASIELSSLTVDNNIGPNWTLSTNIRASGDRATPGTGPGTSGGDNEAPVVWAGPDETVYFDTISASTTLFGMASDADNDPLNHSWTLLSGSPTAVTLSNSQSLRPIATFTTTGLFTFQLASSDGTTSTVDSVTINAIARPSSTATYQVYFGNVHAHSSYSDGNKSNDPLSNGAAAGFRYARDLGGLDWLVISDHNHATAGMNYPDYALGVNEAASVNSESNDFVAIFGTEWGTISTGGHVIYSHSQLWGWEPGNFDVFIDKGDYAALFAQIRNVATFGQLCHPASSHFDNIFNVSYDAAWDESVSTVSVKSGPAFALALDYSDPSASNYQSYYLNLLQKGYRVGPASDQDTHYDNWGLANEQRTAVLATELTQTAILEALKAGRVYATEDYNLQIDFWAQFGSQDYALASVIDMPVGQTITLNMMMNDPDGEGLGEIELLAGDVGGATATTVVNSFTGSLSHQFTPVSEGQLSYFFARVTQPDNDQAWTAPIWIRATASGGNVSPEASFDFNAQNLSCTFSDTSVDSDGTVYRWLWQFGDGNSSAAQHPSHTYSSAGNYAVTLTVTDNLGAIGQATQSVPIVNDQPTTNSYTNSIPGYGSQTYDFTTAGGPIDVSAAWNQSNRDLDLYLYNSVGSLVAYSESVANPELLTVNSVSAGSYTLLVYNYNSRQTNYTLDITYLP